MLKFWEAHEQSKFLRWVKKRGRIFNVERKKLLINYLHTIERASWDEGGRRQRPRAMEVSNWSGVVNAFLIFHTLLHFDFSAILSRISSFIIFLWQKLIFYIISFRESRKKGNERRKSESLEHITTMNAANGNEKLKSKMRRISRNENIVLFRISCCQLPRSRQFLFTLLSNFSDSQSKTEEQSEILPNDSVFVHRHRPLKFMLHLLFCQFSIRSPD